MLPRKRTMPAEPAANPFALSRPAQISVSDEITEVKKALPSLPPPPPVRAAGSSGPPPLPASARAPGSKLPPPLPRVLPRASFVPPSFEEFERAANSAPQAETGQRQASASVGSTKTKAAKKLDDKTSTGDELEPMAITHHPPALVTQTRPSASWAMALLALGVFGGVVTAIIAGGDTDTILRAGAKFIDPAAPTARAAAGQPGLVDVLRAPPTPAPIQAAPTRVEAEKPVAKAEPIVGEPVNISAEPKLKAEVTEIRIYEVREAKAERERESAKEPISKPAARPEPKPEPRVAVAAPARRAEPVRVAAPAPKVAVVEKVEEESAPVPSKRQRKDDFSSAAAANALAKAQLEGSL